MKNPQLLFLFITLLSSLQALSQVGVDTESPKATLDVVGKPTIASSIDGIIAPRLTRANLTAKDGVYGADQIGTLVYVTTLDGAASGKCIYVNAIGYHYFDGALWRPFYIEPWYIQQATLAPATMLNQDIYHMGKTSINLGSTWDSDQLHVRKGANTWNAFVVKADSVPTTGSGVNDIRGIMVTTSPTASISRTNGNIRNTWLLSKPTGQANLHHGLEMQIAPTSTSEITNNIGILLDNRPAGIISGTGNNGMNTAISINNIPSSTSNISNRSVGIKMLGDDVLGTVANGRYGIFQEIQTYNGSTKNYFQSPTGFGVLAPNEKVEINGAIKISDGGYTSVTHNATTPVPAGGAGTIIFIGTHFYGWTGTAWKQLDN